MDGFKRIEKLVFMLSGKIISLVGGSGVLITVMFDRIARDMPLSLGWLQISGIIAFLVLCLFGLYADIFLNDTIKPMITEYLEN
jgi:hypothetical protein